MNFEEHNEWNTEEKQQKKKLWPQLLVGAIILVVFVVVVLMTTEPQAPEVVEEDNEEQVLEEEPEDNNFAPTHNYPEVESEEELIAYFGVDIIGLEKAYELGLVKDINRTIEVDEYNRTLIIEKAWYTSSGIYLIESITHKDDEDLRANFITRYQNEYGALATEDQFGMQVKYKNRIYKIQKLKPRVDDNGNQLTVVENQYTYSIDLRVKNESKFIDNVKVPLNYNSENEASFTHHFDINETIKGDDIEFTFNSVDLGLNGGSIDLNYKTKSEGMFGLSGFINLDGKSHNFDSRYRRDNFSTLSIPMISDNPESLEIHIDKAYIVSDHELDFKVELSDIEEGRKVLDEYIGEHMGIEYYLKWLDYRGVEAEVMIEAYLPGGENVTRHGIRHITPSNYGHVESQLVPNLLTVTNRDGEEFEFGSFSSSGSDSAIGFTLPRELVDDFDTANINISNLSYIEDVNQTVEIDLSGS